jgi:multicomponent Na+:H+ antiporter subunit A
MTPILGGTMLWNGSITIIGALTMVGGSYRALLETDLKRVLAYSTISALGVLMLLFGIGTPQAATAGLMYLLAHACYKGALFLVAGAVEHETGTRDVRELGGLRGTMPVTAVAAALAALSMAGVPLLFGFIAKEQFYQSVAMLALPAGERHPPRLTTHRHRSGSVHCSSRSRGCSRASSRPLPPSRSDWRPHRSRGPPRQ